MTDPNNPADEPKLAKNETIKADSNLLRGTIADGLRDDSTGALAADDTQLTSSTASISRTIAICGGSGARPSRNGPLRS